MQWPSEELELRWRALDEYCLDLQERLTHIRGEMAALKFLAGAVETTPPQPPPAPSPAPVVPKSAPINQGFTGNMCQICGGAHMVRSGTCELCMDCGSTTGCS